jgi:hypothetical protein
MKANAKGFRSFHNDLRTLSFCAVRVTQKVENKIAYTQDMFIGKLECGENPSLPQEEA